MANLALFSFFPSNETQYSNLTSLIWMIAQNERDENETEKCFAKIKNDSKMIFAVLTLHIFLILFCCSCFYLVMVSSKFHSLFALPICCVYGTCSCIFWFESDFRIHLNQMKKNWKISFY